MKDFVYERAETIEDAVVALARDGARALAGGTDLIAQIREGRRPVSRIVDIKPVADLSVVSGDQSGKWRIGASVTATELAANATLATQAPALIESLKLIGSWQIQNRATLAGNICNASPSADGVPVLLCHDATVEIAGATGTRTVALAEFFEGPGATRLQRGELVTAVIFNTPAHASGSAYLRFTPRREMDIAVVGVAARIDLDEAGLIADARLAYAAVAPTPVRLDEVSRTLAGERPDAELFREAGRRAAGAIAPITDTRGSADYRRALTATLTARALGVAAGRAGIEVDVA